MRDYFEKIIQTKTNKANELRAQAAASDNVDEVRSIGDTLNSLYEDIADAKKQLDQIDADEQAKTDEQPAADEQPAEDEGRAAGNPVGGFNPLATYGAAKSDDVATDATSTVEYRSAFKNYVMTGKKSAILDEVRANQTTTTGDVSIPSVLVDKIFERAAAAGMILPLVTQTNYPAGVEISVGALKPVATWINEGATSDTQKAPCSTVTFTHHKIRCVVGVTMEAATMGLAAFEEKVVNNCAEAIVKAKEQAIISGSGSGQPKGITTETPVDGQAISITSGTGLSFATICAAEAALPQAYEGNAVWCMTKKSFYSFEGITDANGQPIARVNYGINGAAERMLLGRPVVLCGDYMPNFNAAPSSDTTFAFLFDFSDYVMNSVYDMGITSRQDWDTEDMQTKAVTACDGKVVDKNSLVTLTVTA